MSINPLPPNRLPPLPSLTRQIPLTSLPQSPPQPPQQPSPLLPPVHSLFPIAHRSPPHYPIPNNHDVLISHIRYYAQSPGPGDRTALPRASNPSASTFRSRENLKQYVRVLYRCEGERPFQCILCDTCFIKKDHAIKHVRAIHFKERPHICLHCHSRFGQRSDLNKHIRAVHLRSKPYACEQCGICFSHRGNQLRHQQVVHEKKRPFPCTLCHSSFAEKSNMLKHRKAVHKINKISLSSSSPKSST